MTASMSQIVRAALGPGPGRFLIFDPPEALVADLAGLGGELVLVRDKARRVRRAGDTAAQGGSTVLRLCAELARLPVEAASFDAVACFGGLRVGVALSDLRRLVRPGGTVLLETSVREGVTGGAASLVRRAARSGALPRASDLTRSMLQAGMRPVRQAAARRGMVPTMVTWAEVRERKWEAAGGSCDPSSGARP